MKERRIHALLHASAWFYGFSSCIFAFWLTPLIVGVRSKGCSQLRTMQCSAKSFVSLQHYEPCRVQQSPLPHSNTTKHTVSVQQSPLPHSANTTKHTVSVRQSPLPHSNTTNNAVSVRQSPLPHSNTDKYTKSFLVATYYCRLDHHLSDHHVEATTLKNLKRLIATRRGHHPKYHLTPTQAFPFCRIHT